MSSLYLLFFATFFLSLNALGEPPASPPPVFDPNQFLDSLSPPMSCDNQAVKPGSSTDLCTDFYGFMCQGKASKLNTNLEKRATAAAKEFAEKAENILKTHHQELVDRLASAPEFSCLQKDPSVESACARDFRKEVASVAGNRLLGGMLKEPFPVNTSLGTTDRVIDSLEELQLVDILAQAPFDKLKDSEGIGSAETLFKEKIQPAAIRAANHYLPSGLSEQRKKQVRHKLETVHYKDTNCNTTGFIAGLGTPTQKANRRLSRLLIPNAFYDPLTHSLQVCNGLIVDNDSLGNLTFLLGHEISHSIDPAGISSPFSALGDPYFTDQVKKGRKDNFFDTLSKEDFDYIAANTFEYADKKDPIKALLDHPSSKVLSCLRSADSVGALRFDDLIAKARDLEKDPETLQMVRRVARKRGDALSNAYQNAKTDAEKQSLLMQMRALTTFRFVDAQIEVDKAAEEKPKASNVEKDPNSPRLLAGRLGQRQANPFWLLDQIGESFADFMGVEILVDALHATYPNMTSNQAESIYASVLDATCDSALRAGPYGDPHPLSKDRVNRILLAHPTVRKQLGCPAAPKEGPVYCGEVI